MYDVLLSRKKKLKRLPSLKFCRSKSEIFRPPLLEIGSSWARFFCSGSGTCDVIDLPMIAIDFSRFLSKVSAKCLSIQKFNLGKVCLKVVVKVALSLQRLASARQVKISNHTMIMQSQLIATEQATQYVRWTNSWRGRRRGHASQSICWQDRSTRLVFYLFPWFSILSAFINASIFVKRAHFQAVCFEGS